jgi:hypothetical protein
VPVADKLWFRPGDRRALGSEILHSDLGVNLVFFTIMFRSIFDNLPVEIVLLVVDNLDPKNLLSLLRAICWLTELLTGQQATISDKKGNTTLHLLAENGETELIKLLLLISDNFNLDLRNGSGETIFLCG